MERDDTPPIYILQIEGFKIRNRIVSSAGPTTTSSGAAIAGITMEQLQQMINQAIVNAGGNNSGGNNGSGGNNSSSGSEEGNSSSGSSEGNSSSGNGGHSGAYENETGGAISEDITYEIL